MSSNVYAHFLKYKYIWIASAVLFVYLLPYYVLGEDTHIRVHDNLDSNIVWYKLLVESGLIFAEPGATLPNVINGLPRSALASGFDAMVWLYKWFEPMTAYAIGQTIMRIGALYGMYMLLSRHVFKKEQLPGWLIPGIAVLFAMLPFWPSGMLSIAGLPLAFHLFLTIREKGKTAPWYIWVMVGVLPFFSNFILTFVFFLGVMGLLWLYDWIQNRQSNWVLFSSIAGMTLVYLAKNYLLIYSMFLSSGFTSHRDENSLGHNSFSETIDLFVHNFINGHTHDLAVQTKIIIPAALLGLFIALFKKFTPKRLLLFLLANGALSLWYAFWYFEGWRVLKDRVMILNTFNFSRIHFFDPMIWYLIFAMVLYILWRQVKFGGIMAFVLLIAQGTLVFSLNEEAKYSEIGTPTFSEFYSVEMFDHIKDYIGKEPSSYQVASIGMHPTIAQYNGMYTVDTYNNSYPLEYKHAFREIIAPELKKDSNLESYFDTWGGRLYMYSSELGKHYMFEKDSDQTIEELDIDLNAFRELGGDYILSSVSIENWESLGLEFEKSFTTKDSPWKIYLYNVPDPS
ncbi:putative membrane protein YkoS [Lentibacillus sp. JNUCC-1]|uniref:DUF6044 family protein n=1 Tax=Lentibacillus sp. JNUCC-1 TaxID=2654513 RepID=UPI0012E99271|nr:DUF6044 family protein [Lentibacillus sp. JNUCC-1]MUV36477.1 putative membrane protein YkoS [Lentibacillus sp. JNUCC-1]